MDPGTGSSAKSGLLQLALSGTEGNEGLVICDQLVESERIRHPHKVLHGDGLFGLGVNQEGGCHVLDQPQRCVLSVSRPSGISFVSAVCRSGDCVSVPDSLLRPFY